MCDGHLAVLLSHVLCSSHVVVALGCRHLVPRGCVCVAVSGAFVSKRRSLHVHNLHRCARHRNLVALHALNSIIICVARVSVVNHKFGSSHLLVLHDIVERCDTVALHGVNVKQVAVGSVHCVPAEIESLAGVEAVFVTSRCADVLLHLINLDVVDEDGSVLRADVDERCGTAVMEHKLILAPCIVYLLHLIVFEEAPCGCHAVGLGTLDDGVVRLCVLLECACAELHEEDAVVAGEVEKRSVDLAAVDVETSACGISAV